MAVLGLSACYHRKLPSSHLLLATNEASGDLSVIDTTSQALVATIPLGKRPRGIRVSPDQRFAYIALSGSPAAGPNADPANLPPADHSADGIGVVDIAARRLVRVLHAGTDPEQLALSIDGSRIFVANEDAGALSMLDASSGNILASFPVGDEPEGVAVRPDNQLVYVTSEAEGTVYAIAPGGAGVLAKIKVGRRPRSIVFLRGGSVAYVTLEADAAIAVVDSVRHQLLSTISLGPQLGTKDTPRPMGLVAAKDESAIFVTAGWNGGVFIVDPRDNKPTGRIAVGGRLWGIAISADQRTLYTANGPTNDVAVIDLAKRQVIKKIPVGDRPWGLALAGT